MRRALIGTLAGWVTGAAGVLAQSPLPPMPSPYATYAPATAGAPQYGPVAQPTYGPAMPPPAYGPAPTYGPTFGPSYAPVMTAGGMVPPNGNAQPLPAPNPVPGGPAPLVPEGQVLPPPMMVPNPGMAMPNGAVMPGPNGAIMPGPNGMMMPNGAPMPNGGMILGPNPGWWGPNGQCADGSCGMVWNGEWNGNCGNPWSRCPYGPCGPEGRVWASAELLLWWTKGQELPPLVARGVGPGNPGVLGRAGTVVLFGGGAFGELMRVGVRSRLGFWIDECQTLGVEGSFFYLGRIIDNFRTQCVVGDVVGRPFFNIDPAVNAPDAELVCMPGVLHGDVAIAITSQFYGADVNIRRNLCCNCNSRVDVFGGFRYLHLSDTLSIEENLVNLDPARGAVGEGFFVVDSFAAVNNFYGGQIGLTGEIRSGNIFFDWRAGIALGSTTRRVTIDGSTTFFDPAGGAPVIQPGGLLAQPSNIGVYDSSDFSIVPEVNVNLGYAVSPNVRLYAGYSFLYWTNVARAGEQINLNVDARQLPTRLGPGVGIGPVFVLNRNDFWAQGVNLGIQFRY